MTAAATGGGKIVQAQRAPILRSLLISTALTGVIALNSGSAWAACSNSGIPTNTVTCTGSDTNGHTIAAVGRLTVNVAADAVVSRSSGDALNLGALGTLNINTAAGSSIQGGTSGYGILAGTTSGGTITTNGDISGSLDAVNVTFSANTVVYNNSGTVTGGDAGIVINRDLGTGSTTLTNTGTIVAGEDGVRINRNSGSGDVTVTNAGAIGTATTRVGDDGIDVNIKTSGTIAITNSAAGSIYAVDAGIDATNADGAVTVTNLGTIDASGVAVNAYGTIGVSINNSGTLIGLGTGVRATVVAVADGDVTIINDGAVTTATDDPAGRAVMARSSQAIQLTNGLTILGTVELGNPGATPTSSIFDNDGLWQTSGASSFLALNDVTLNNTGDIITTGTTTWTMESTDGDNTFANVGSFEVRGDTTFLMATVSGANVVQNRNTIHVGGSLAYQGGTGLVFDNHGLLDMRGNSTNDRTTISGVFTGLAGSRMAIDASLGGAGSEADWLFAGEATAGVTSLVVQDSNSGPGGINLQGIVFAYTPTGNSMLGDFVLDPSSDHYDATRGVLDKGLFFYDIATRAGIDNPDGVAQVLIGVPDVELFQAPHALTAVQHVWHETAGAWLDRTVDLRGGLMQSVGVVAADPIARRGDGKFIDEVSRAIDLSLWTKIVGSGTSRSDRESFSLQDRAYSFDTGYNQDVLGVVAGIDYRMSGILDPSDTLVLGAMAGYVSSELDFNSLLNGFDTSGGTAGLYASYLTQGFFIDVLAKADMLDTQWRMPSLSGFGTSVRSGDSTSYGVRADTGLRFMLNPSFFIEPSATLAYVHTDIDPLTTAGSTMDFQSAESVRGAMGLRVGADIMASDDFAIEASISGRIWNEFQGANRVNVESSGSTLQFDDNIQGMFGELAGSLNVLSRDDGWSGGLSGGVTFSDDMATLAVKGSLRHVW